MDRGCDSGNISVGADDKTAPITGCTPGLTYNITLLALSDHLPSPIVDVVMVTLGETHILEEGGGGGGGQGGNYSITPVVTNIIPYCSMSSSDGL